VEQFFNGAKPPAEEIARLAFVLSANGIPNRQTKQTTRKPIDHGSG
jgi:hypothetical protein